MTDSIYYNQKITRLLVDHAANADHIGVSLLLRPEIELAGNVPRFLSWMTVVDQACYAIAQSRLLSFPARYGPPAIALEWAATAGCAECVRSLILAHGPGADCSPALTMASMRGNVECVRLLIPFFDPNSHGSQALQSAANNGHVECCMLLLACSDPKANESDALLRAARNGHRECVKLLAGVSHPLSTHPAPLHAAIETGRAAIAAYMLEQDPALAKMIDPILLAAEASQKGHAELASFLRSLAEKLSLAASASAPLPSATSLTRL